MSNLSTEVLKDYSKEVSIGLDSVFSEYKEKKEKIEYIHHTVYGKNDEILYFLKGNQYRSFEAENLFKLEGALAALNAEYWSLVMKKTDVLECMPAKMRNEWNEMISDMKTPDFTLDSVLATLKNMLASRESFMSQKVSGIFHQLSGEHVTNVPNGFRSKIIMARILNNWGSADYSMCGYLHDLRSVIAKLQGRDVGSVSCTSDIVWSIVQESKFGEKIEIDGCITLKVFKKGTAHLEIDEDIAQALNEVLAGYHAGEISAGRNSSSKKKKKERVYHDDFLSRKTMLALKDISDAILRGRSPRITDEDEEMLRVVSFLGGEVEGRFVSFPFNAQGAINEIIRSGRIPNLKSHQFYPTRGSILEELGQRISIEQGDSVLEPSAGHGDILDFFNLKNEDHLAVEISPVNAKIMESKGYNVIQCDFMEFTSKHLFDKVIMNPPFSEGQAKAQFSKAVLHLKPGGQIAAIIPAGCQVDTTGLRNVTESSPIEGAFEGASVRVKIVYGERL